MQTIASLGKHRAELSRALRNHQYEVTDAGIEFPRQHLLMGGRFRYHDHQTGEIDYSGNIVPTAALSYALKAALAGAAQILTWYVAPFSNNVTPAATLTAATFNATQGEFVNYTEASRPLWTQLPEANQTISNGLNDAIITAAAGGGTVWGAALISVATKGSTAGTLLAASKRATAKTLDVSDSLGFGYDIIASST